MVQLILFLGFGWGRVVSGAYAGGKGKLDVPQMNSDSVNSFPNPHSIRKVPFTVSIPLLLLLLVSCLFFEMYPCGVILICRQSCVDSGL